MLVREPEAEGANVGTEQCTINHPNAPDINGSYGRFDLETKLMCVAACMVILNSCN